MALLTFSLVGLQCVLLTPLCCMGGRFAENCVANELFFFTGRFTWGIEMTCKHKFWQIQYSLLCVWDATFGFVLSGRDWVD